MAFSILTFFRGFVRFENMQRLLSRVVVETFHEQHFRLRPDEVLRIRLSLVGYVTAAENSIRTAYPSAVRRSHGYSQNLTNLHSRSN